MRSCCADNLVHAAAWADKQVQLPHVSLRFSWKPEMFSLDDVQLLERRSKTHHPGVIILHKGVHTVFNWLEGLEASRIPEELYWAELRARTSMLIGSIKRLFPNSILFWRDMYYHHSNEQLEKISTKVRAITSPSFEHHGFKLIPGYNLTAEVPTELRSIDGIHQTTDVKNVVISMIACVLCNDTSA